MKPATLTLLPFLALLSACGGEPPPGDHGLPALGANPSVSVSGISSGGYMAGQYQVANSARVSGAAIVAAGPWACSLGELGRALGPCMTGDGIDVAPLAAKADEMATAGRIDPLAGLADQRVLVFRGSNDQAIGAAVTGAAAEFLARADSDERIIEIEDVPAAHGWVTDGSGGACDSFESPYIVDCGYDLAGAILEHVYGELEPAATATGSLVTFEQAPFGDASLAESGYAYIPDACSSEECRIHVFFHGCEQSADTIGTTLADKAGFNRWAESNNIVVLYPQVAPSKIAPMNPLGCWDWWGYTGEDFAAKDAPQIAAVREMVERLASR